MLISNYKIMYIHILIILIIHILIILKWISKTNDLKSLVFEIFF